MITLFEREKSQDKRRYLMGAELGLEPDLTPTSMLLPPGHSGFQTQLSST